MEYKELTLKIQFNELLRRKKGGTKGSDKVKNPSIFVEGNKRLKGVTGEQWQQMQQYSLVGNCMNKKENYNTGVTHLFNLKALFQKINQYQTSKKHKRHLAPSISHELTQKEVKKMKMMIPESFEGAKTKNVQTKKRKALPVSQKKEVNPDVKTQNLARKQTKKK